MAHRLNHHQPRTVGVFNAQISAHKKPGAVAAHGGGVTLEFSVGVTIRSNCNLTRLALPCLPP